MSRIIYHLDGKQIILPIEGITQATAPYVRTINGYPDLKTKKIYYMVDLRNHMEFLVKIICGGINNRSDDGIIVIRYIMLRFTGDQATEWMERQELFTVLLDDVAEDEREGPNKLHFYEAHDITPVQDGGRKTKRRQRRRQSRRRHRN